MRQSITKRIGFFEVIGPDLNDPTQWKVRRPDGLECSGRWHSESDALRDCDLWNSQHKKTLQELNHTSK